MPSRGSTSCSLCPDQPSDGICVSTTGFGLQPTTLVATSLLKNGAPVVTDILVVQADGTVSGAPIGHFEIPCAAGNVYSATASGTSAASLSTPATLRSPTATTSLARARPRARSTAPTSSAANSSATIGADGLGLISYFDGTSGAGDLKVVHCNNVFCAGASTSYVDAGSVSVGDDSSATIGADGLGLISYFDLDSADLKVAHCSNTFCVPYLRRR